MSLGCLQQTSPRYSGACALSLASALTGGGGTVDGGSLVLGVLSALSGALVGVVGSGMCCEFGDAWWHFFLKVCEDKLLSKNI